MTPLVHDFLDEVEHELVAQRRRAAREVDRADALYHLRNRALSASAALGRAITAEDVFSSAKDEKERAEVQALVDRIASPDPGGNPAHDEEGERANGAS
jgi:hypothetical protein